MSVPFGFIVIDKPKGITSHDCVNHIRRIFGVKHVGHGGTLDPAVTGVLPIALGPATRLFPYLPGKKSYTGVIQLGKRTTSDDLEGETISNQSWPMLNQLSLEKELNQFRGSIQQRPPNVSSVHVQGERAYKKVLKGESFELPKKNITIHKLLVTKWDPIRGQIELDIDCSSGTYVRSLARDLGNSLGCGGCLAKLRRTQALGFDENQSWQLQKNTHKELEVKPNLISPIEALQHLNSFQIKTKEEEIHWRTGRQLKAASNSINPTRKPLLSTDQEQSQFIAVIDLSGELVGIAIWSTPSDLQPKIVFNALG